MLRKRKHIFPRREHSHRMQKHVSNTQLIEIQIVHPAKPSMIFFFVLFFKKHKNFFLEGRIIICSWTTCIAHLPLFIQCQVISSFFVPGNWIPNIILDIQASGSHCDSSWEDSLNEVCALHCTLAQHCGEVSLNWYLNLSNCCSHWMHVLNSKNKTETNKQKNLLKLRLFLHLYTERGHWQLDYWTSSCFKPQDSIKLPL